MILLTRLLSQVARTTSSNFVTILTCFFYVSRPEQWPKNCWSRFLKFSEQL